MKVCHAMTNMASISTTTTLISKSSLETFFPVGYFVKMHHFRKGAWFTDQHAYAILFKDILVVKFESLKWDQETPAEP